MFTSPLCRMVEEEQMPSILFDSYNRYTEDIKMISLLSICSKMFVERKKKKIKKNEVTKNNSSLRFVIFQTSVHQIRFYKFHIGIQFVLFDFFPPQKLIFPFQSLSQKFKAIFHYDTRKIF